MVSGGDCNSEAKDVSGNGGGSSEGDSGGEFGSGRFMVWSLVLIKFLLL